MQLLVTFDLTFYSKVDLTPDYLNDVLGLRDTWLAFVCLLGIILAIILLILLALRQRIQIAIEVCTFLQY